MGRSSKLQASKHLQRQPERHTRSIDFSPSFRLLFAFCFGFLNRASRSSTTMAARILLRRLLRPSLRRPQLGPDIYPPQLRPTSTSSTSTTTARIDKLLSRLPSWSQKYTSRLRAAPLSHITAFLILHELTAIIPVLGLFGAFHYYADISPLLKWMGGHNYGSYVTEGAARFERYFRRKGWFGFGGEEEEQAGKREDGAGGEETAIEKWREDGDMRYKVVVEVALAYAITKALLPVRIIGSVWATPWFAGVLVRLRKVIRPSR